MSCLRVLEGPRRHPWLVCSRRIRDGQLGGALIKVLGDTVIALVVRVSYMVVLGPEFAWYMLARGVMGLTQAATEDAMGTTASAEVEGSGPSRRRN